MYIDVSQAMDILALSLAVIAFAMAMLALKSSSG